MPNEESIMTSFELDQIKEVINIGASHASTALYQMIKKKVTLTVPEVFVDNVENIIKHVGNENEVMTAVLLRVLGDAPGMMTLFFPQGSENDLITLLTMKERKPSKLLDEFERSVLKEVGNILAGASLSAFAKFLNINVVHTVSEITTNMVGAVINSIMAEMGQTADKALIATVNMTVAGEKIKTQLFFFLDPSATSKILDLTSKKL